MKINTTSLRDFILANYDQVSLFSKYTGISELVILDCINNNKRTINSLRNEENASLAFTYWDNKVRMHDYGALEYRGDIFDLVGLLLNVNSSERDGFIKICKFIINNSSPNVVGLGDYDEKKEHFTKIEFTPRNFNTNDLDYWMVGLHTTMESLRQNGVYPVKSANVFSKKHYYYSYKESDTCYAYFFDILNEKNLIKLYFNNRDKHSVRYITNNRLDFEGVNALYKTDYLVITKGYKERLILRNYLPNNYCVTNFSSEATWLSREKVIALLSIYKSIFINVDYDLTGVTNAYYHYSRFNNSNINSKYIIPVFINNRKPVIIDGDKTRYLYKTLVKTNNLLEYDELLVRLKEFTNTHLGEYQEKDFFDLARVISPTVMKEYIKNKFRTV